MARSAKIVHLTSVHSPFDTRIFHKECRTLAQSGLETVLIAPHEQDELSCGVRIKFLPKPLNRWRRMTTTPWQVYKMALTEDALVYHFHDSELIPISLLLKLHGKLLIYDVHEDLPRQILNKDWIPSRLRKTVAKLAELVEILSTRFFDGVVAATPTIAKRFSAAKTVDVANFPIFFNLYRRITSLFPKGSDNRVCRWSNHYAGNRGNNCCDLDIVGNSRAKVGVSWNF